jgi:hypothetical protein
MSILAQLASDDVPDSAYQWLCQRRRDYSANSDVWNFRHRLAVGEATHQGRTAVGELSLLAAVAHHSQDQR